MFLIMDKANGAAAVEILMRGYCIVGMQNLKLPQNLVVWIASQRALHLKLYFGIHLKTVCRINGNRTRSKNRLIVMKPLHEKLKQAFACGQ